MGKGIGKLLETKRHNDGVRKELTRGIQCWQHTGRTSYKVSEAVHTLIKDAISGFDYHVHQVFRNLNVISKSEVRDMVDKLAESG